MTVKSLLALGVVTWVSTSASAWEKPVAPAGYPADPAAQAAFLDGETNQYVYNAGAHAFFCGGNDWGTRASVSDTIAAQVHFTAESEGCYSIYNDRDGAHSFLRMFVDGPTGIWVDNNGGANGTTWTLNLLDGSMNFEIGNTAFPGELLVSSSGLIGAGNTRLFLSSAADVTGDVYSQWYSVSAENYTAFVEAAKAYYHSDAYIKFTEDTKIYNAAMDLKKALDDAKVKHPSAMIAEFEAVYNNEASTEEELRKAIEGVELAVKIAIAEEAEASASVKEPKDMSGLIVNGTFDVIGDFHGWSGTAFGAGGTKGPCAEHYEKNYNTYQKLENLPNGVYAVLMDGFYRWGGTGNAFDTKGQKTPAYLYATNQVDTLTTSIMGQFDCIEEGEPVEGTTYKYEKDGKTYYVPNSMADACTFFEAGKYKDNKVYFGVTDGVASIGVMKDQLLSTDWTLVDNFRLIYYGKAEDAYQMWMDEAKKDLQSYDTWADDVTVTYLEAYNAAVEVAQEATNYEQVIGNIKAVKTAEDALLANKKAWDDLNAEIEHCRAQVATLVGPDAEALGDYLDFDITDMVNNKEASTEDVIKQIETLKEMLDKAVENGLQPGSDATDYIVNASFKNGFDGWTKKAGTAGGLKAFPCVEVYENVVEISQEVTLPNGVYELSCQAFERPAGNGNYTGAEPSKVFLFMNSVETPVQNIMASALPEADAKNLENCFIEAPIGEEYYDTGGTTNTDYLTNDASYVPNGMSGASYAFRAGRYTQSAKGLVTDGKMKIGLTSKGVKAHWVLWANFKLTYLGNDPTVVKPLLEQAAGELATDKAYGSDIKAEVDNIAAEIAEAINSGDGDVMVKTLDKVYQLKEKQAESINTFAQLATDADNAIQSIDNEFEKADPDLKKEALAFCQAAAAGAQGTYTQQEAVDAIAKIKAYLKCLSIPANIKEATEANPVDITGILVNPSFETNNFEGWVNSGAQEFATQGNTSFAKVGSYYAEKWHSNGTLDISQTVEGANLQLPEGIYRVTVNAYASIDDAVVYINEVETPIENTADAMVSATYSAKVSVPAATDFKIGAKGTLTSSTWFCIDNFVLEYLGVDADAIEVVENKENVVKTAIYDINGAQLATLKKGINIVRLSNGKVRKLIVK